jgi:hypothetical protein
VVEKAFEVYPNPASEKVSLRANTPQKVEWTLFDSWGRAVKTGMLRGLETEFDVQDLPSGMYVLRVGKGFVRKLIVNE